MPGPSRRTPWPTPVSSWAPASGRSSGHLWVDRTSTERLEKLFADMAERGYATSTIDRNWNYLNQALEHGQRHRTIKTNPAADVLLPEKRAGKTRKSLSIDQMQHLVVEAIPADPRPARWLTGLMCGLSPGELAGLRWRFVDIDSDSPSIHVVERALEVEDRYIGQAVPKTPRSKRRTVFTRCSWPRCAVTVRTCGHSRCTTTRASCSVRGTAPR